MNGQLVTAYFPNEISAEIPRRTPINELIPEYGGVREMPILGALVNNVACELSSQLESDAKIRFLDIRDDEGWLIYRYSVLFLLTMAVDELYPDYQFTVEHAIGSGFFCHFEHDSDFLGAQEVENIESKMNAIVESKLPIERLKIPFEAAIKEFEERSYMDKYKLLRFRNPPYIDMHRCGDFQDLAHGVLAANTEDIGPFACIPHQGGLILQLTTRQTVPEIPEFRHQPNHFQIFREHRSWGGILGVRTAGDLNETIADGDIRDYIRSSEALHEKKIANLADRIAGSDDHIKWIFIAGPSSSGKTTFAKRLGTQLRLNGLRPFPISIDDYFLPRAQTPLGDDGKPDFESIDAVDVPFLHEQLMQLEAGETVQLPLYNFTTGLRETHPTPFRIGENQIVIVEGIHGLNPEVWNVLPREHIHRIYISALTQMNLDCHNRLSTTDNRLMRRMVRDHNSRGHDALATLRMWQSVRRGEDRWIFPYQEEADAAFNSALDYEIPVLKPLVEQLLLEVKPYHDVYPTARRIIELLANFLTIPEQLVPPTSLLREFIGKSDFSSI